MSILNYEIKPESSVAAIAGELFADTSLFREISDKFGIDEFELSTLEDFEGRILQFTETLTPPVVNTIASKLDLSNVKGGSQLRSNPWQNISWLV